MLIESKMEAVAACRRQGAAAFLLGWAFAVRGYWLDNKGMKKSISS